MVKGSGFRVQGSRFKVHDAGCRIHGWRVYVCGLMVWEG
jgi:hypothetical protein